MSDPAKYRVATVAETVATLTPDRLSDCHAFMIAMLFSQQARPPVS